MIDLPLPTTGHEPMADLPRHWSMTLFADERNGSSNLITIYDYAGFRKGISIITTVGRLLQYSFRHL